MAQNLAKKVVVDLFFDTVSPYSYLAFESLNKYKVIWSKMDLKLHPVFLPAIMSNTGNKPPGMLPARSQYMTKDLFRQSDFFGVPFKFPSNVAEVMFIKGTIKAQRLLTAVSRESPELLEPLAKELYSRIWVKDLDVATPESLLEACLDIGLSKERAEDLVGKITDADVKDALKAQTDVALEHGAYGVPSYVVHCEDGSKMLFGVDHLYLLAHYLGEPFVRPVDDTKVASNL